MAEDHLELIDSINDRWEHLTIADDFVFCKAMLDPELCADVLEAILGVPIDHIEYVGRQGTLDSRPSNKGIRLDVYVRDGNGTVFDVEMQSTNTHELPKRARYYQSLLTIDQLRRGASYRTVNDTYIIFICNFDLFGLGQRVYPFENVCMSANGLTLDDGTKTIFLAATAPQREHDDARVGELLDYVAKGEVTGDLSARLAAAIADVLDDRKWRLEYMILEITNLIDELESS